MKNLCKIGKWTRLSLFFVQDIQNKLHIDDNDQEYRNKNIIIKIGDDLGEIGGSSSSSLCIFVATKKTLTRRSRRKQPSSFLLKRKF